MTAQQLHKKLRDQYGVHAWPKTIIVDAETYGNVCQDIFDFKRKDALDIGSDLRALNIVLGPNNGIIFKHVELLLEIPIK